ncbi:hypothetical protein PENSUB_13394 [Penicillium subrubescens]|uniref:Uncharacterized protein n=1 Tax=Penicillium subrubescens TaxID=1316194 RepID=A0A1Q5SQI4_9EURO|nr:hypothetical protein PENSUB_13394 [Penicillium subrubescens]
MPPEPILTQLWRRESICKRLNHDLSTNDLISCRLVCRDLAAQSAPDLFTDITIRFRCRSLSRPSRVSALERIGHHIRQVTFIIAHTAETFLPPVIDAGTGKEQTFVYTPQHQQGPPRSPKYGTWEMTDLLLKQYPPLFHAATDVPSFVRVLSLMKNLRHLRITCEGQPPSHRYRRSVVDYTLISLRIAAEQFIQQLYFSSSQTWDSAHRLRPVSAGPKFDILPFTWRASPTKRVRPRIISSCCMRICRAFPGFGRSSFTGKVQEVFRHCRWQVSPVSKMRPTKDPGKPMAGTGANSYGH